MFKALLNASKDEKLRGSERTEYLTSYSVLIGIATVVTIVTSGFVITALTRVAFQFYVVYACADKAPEVVKMIVEAITGR